MSIFTQLSIKYFSFEHVNSKCKKIESIGFGILKISSQQNRIECKISQEVKLHEVSGLPQNLLQKDNLVL